MLTQRVERALSALKKGEIICIYDSDDRERETDMVIASQFITPDVIRTMRKHAGGLICATIAKSVADTIGLPFMADVIWHAANRYPILKEVTPNDIPYDEKSSFSISINARDTFTGITDIDRAKTIKKLSEFIARVVREPGASGHRREFGRIFRSPGHVPLLITSDRILEKRFGHTELATAMVIMAGLTPSATVCEIMGDNGYAMPKSEVMAMVEREGIVFVEGHEIVEAWRQWSV